MSLPERNPEANMPGYDFARFSDSGEQTSSVAASPGSIPKTGRDIVDTVAGGAVMGLATFISGRFFVTCWLMTCYSIQPPNWSAGLIPSLRGATDSRLTSVPR